MKVILRETVPSLGIIGSEAIVADGYARNYLLPQGLAVKDTKQNRQRLQQERAKIDLQIVKEQTSAEEMVKQLEGVTCMISAKTGEEDRLYGSVTTRDIVDALAKQGIVVEKRMVLLSSAIKSIGVSNVPIQVYKGVEAEIVVEVVAE